jgi:uncharacterized protein (TIGR03118 family)
MKEMGGINAAIDVDKLGCERVLIEDGSYQNVLVGALGQFRDGNRQRGTSAVLHVDNSEVPTAPTGAVYKGLAIATVNGNQFLYATNFRSGTVDVFDSGYNPVSLTGTFTDPNQIPGFAPFGITLFGNNLWVSYAMQDAAKHDPVHQAGADSYR